MESKCFGIVFERIIHVVRAALLQGRILIDCVRVLGWPAQEPECLCQFGFL